MTDDEEFYSVASRLSSEGLGDLALAPMGYGAGDPAEAQAAIERHRTIERNRVLAALALGEGQ